MAAHDRSLIQECANCSALIDVAGEEPFALMHCPTCGAAMRVRKIFDQFEIEELLGSGGMGSVYRARDTNLDRPVALKLLHPQHSENPEFIVQFQKEAAITASINHPHVVKVYSTGQDNGLVYIAMELVDQGSLDAEMSKLGRVPEIEVLNVGLQIAQGLHAALERGLIHRDIKPGNILFASASTAKIVDFGLAVLMEHAGAVAGEVWGTPAYVPPETLDSRPEDFRSDMYALGATLFHALTGRTPHEGETNSMHELLEIKRKPVNVEDVFPEVSSATAYVLNKMLRFEPAERHQSYPELIEHLTFARTEFLGRQDESPAKAQRAEKSMRWLTLATTVLVVACGVTGFKIHEHQQREQAKENAPDAVQEVQRKIDTQYEEARKLLIAGETDKAAAAFAQLDGMPAIPQPRHNWITLHAGLAELLRGQDETARARFAKIEQLGLYSPDPAEQKLAKFFVETSRQAGADQPATAKDIDATDCEALALFIFGVKNWMLGKYDDAGALLRQFVTATPQERHAWVSEYKPLAAPYLADLTTVRTALDTAKTATTLDTRKQAVQALQAAKGELKKPGTHGAPLAVLEQELQKKIAAEEEEIALRMAALEAADAKALADGKSRAVALWQQFKYTEGYQQAVAVKVGSDKAKTEREALVKKAEWLARFKITLIADIIAVGYASPLVKRTGIQMPGVVRRATEANAEIVTPFGTLPVPWTEVSPDSIFHMGQSFLRAPQAADKLADRQWFLGVYAFQVNKAKEGRELLIQASQVKEEYRDRLSLFLEPAENP